MRNLIKTSLALSCSGPGETGSYNDILAIMIQGYSLVMRLSYYSPYTLARVQALIRQDMPYRDLLHRARRITALDPVQIKNNMARVCNVLADTGVCPHFVYMFAERDVKCFAQLLRDQLKPERMRNMLSFRYNNLSFHERFQSSLRVKVRQLSELQLHCAMFQVFFTLAILQQNLPEFRHNDLSLDNVLLNVYVPKADNYIHYRIGSIDYYTPDVGVFCAVTDFDLAHAPCVVNLHQANMKNITLMNHLIAKDQFGGHDDEQARRINASHNPGFDAYYFLFRLADALKKPAAASPGGQHARFLRKVQGLGVLQEGVRYIDKTIPSLHPSALLRGPFFQAFRQRPSSGASVVSHYNMNPVHQLTITRTQAPPPRNRRTQRRKVSIMDVL